MNHIYRTVFSQVKGCWIAVSELGHSAKKNNKKRAKKHKNIPKLVMKHSLLSSAVLLSFVPAKSVRAAWLGIDNGRVHSSGNGGGENIVALNPIVGGNDSQGDLVGNYGIAVGTNAQAKGVNTVSVGADAKANNTQATAIGNASGAAAQSVAVGADTYAVGKSSIAIGNDDLLAGDEGNSDVENEYGVKLPETTITNIFSGIYKDNKFLTEDDFKKKYISSDNGAKDTRVYSPTFAGKRGAIAIGSRTIAGGETSTSIGSLSFALADNSTAMGIQAFVAADAKGGTAIGERSRVFAGNSVAIGNRTEASNQGTVAYGYNAKAVGNSSIAIGANVAAAAQFDTSKSADLVNYYAKLNTSLTSNNDTASALNDFDAGLHLVLKNGLPLTTVGDTYLTVGHDEIKKLATSNGGATGQNAENAVVIGNKSFASKKNSLAVGYATLADADNSFALGSYTYVNSRGVNSIGLGVGSYVTARNSFAGGTSATVKADNSIALGAKSYVGESLGNSNAIGVNANVLSSKSTALGTDVSVSNWSDNSIVLGNDSKLGGGSGYSVIIGDNANIAKDSVANSNTAISPYAIAIGQSSAIGVNAGNSIAIGAKSRIENDTTRSIAFGNEASADLDNSVALGYRSTTKYFYNPNLKGANTYGAQLTGSDANNLKGYVPPGSSYELPVDNSAGVISVGGWSTGDSKNPVGLRRIINVSPGALDTDVATVGQLRALYYAKTEPNMVYYADINGQKIKLTIDGEQFVPVDTATGEPIKGAVPVPKHLVKIGVKNPNAMTEEVSIAMKGIDGTTSEPKELKLLGSEMVVGNVANGTIADNSKDAINGSQLADLSSKLGTTLLAGNQGFAQPSFTKLIDKTGHSENQVTTFKAAIDRLITTVNQGIIFSDGQAKIDNNHQSTQYLGSKLTLTPAETTTHLGQAGGQNIAIEYHKDTLGNGTFTFAIKNEPIFNKISGGENKPQLDFTGDNLFVNNKKLTGLANADVSSNSSDAVTGKQLFALADDPATAVTQGITVNKNKWKEFLDVGSSVFKFKGNTGGEQQVTLGKGSVFSIEGENGITTESSKNRIKITLNTDLTGINSISNGNTKITLARGGVDLAGSKITNLGAGNLVAGSKDGVNADQVYNTLKNLLGDNIPLVANGDSLTTSAGSTGIAGVENATNIGDAIAKLNHQIKNVSDNLGSTKLAYKATNNTTSTLGTAVALSTGLDFIGDKNIITGVADNGQVTFSLKDTLTGIHSIAGTGTTVTFSNDGINLGNKKITGIANGDISSESKQAINGGQIHIITEALKNILGNDVSFDPTTGKISVKATPIIPTGIDPDKVQDRGGIGGTGANTISEAISRLQHKVTNGAFDLKIKSTNDPANQGGNDAENSTTLTAGLNFTGDKNLITKVENNGVVNINLKRNLNIDSVNLGSAENDRLTLNKDGLSVKGENGKETVITDNGVTVTGEDGAKSELAKDKLVFKDKDNTPLAGIKADSKDKLSLVGGSDGVLLDNLKGGEIQNGSKQAVTGDQVAGLIGKQANVDGTVNNLGGTNSNTIDGAISEVNTKVNDLSGKIDGGLSFTSDNGTTKKKLGETLEIKGGATDLSENNIGVVTEDNIIKVKLAENLAGIKSIKFKDGITIDENGITGIKSIFNNGGDVVASLAEVGSDESLTSNVPSSTSPLSVGDFTRAIYGNVIKPIVTYDNKGKTVENENIASAINHINTNGTKYFQVNAENTTAKPAQAAAINSIAVGANALIDESATNAVALGSNSEVRHQNSVAIGSGAKATLNEAELQKTSEIASGENVNVIGEVSFGQNNTVRRVTHIADGVNVTDAVNLGQLSEVTKVVKRNTDRIKVNTAGIKANANAIDRLTNQATQDRNEYRAGVAGAVATGSLPQAYIPGKSMIAIAGGTYKGQNSFAIGVSKISDNGKIVLKLTGSSNSQGDMTGGVGVGYQW